MNRLCWLALLWLGACDPQAGVTDTSATANVLRDGTGHALCAAGGPVSGGGTSGVMCLSPLEVAGHQATNDTTSWHPGPVGTVHR